MQTAAGILEEGGVDAIDVSAGTYDSMTASIEPMSYRKGGRSRWLRRSNRSFGYPWSASG